MADSSSIKPIILVTHSRSCSTIIERIFWAHKDIKCYHEHFGDAYYFGPEKISDNWTRWPKGKLENSGKTHVTYRMALEDILQDQRAQKYVFNKDMSYHIVPPRDSDVKEIPSLKDWDDGAASVRQNPTWLPTSAIRAFQYAFLIRSPWLAVPSLYRLHVPPAVYETHEPLFKAGEIGYREMRVLIEYFCPQACRDMDKEDDSDVGSKASATSEELSSTRPLVIDASDVLAAPEVMMGKFCAEVGLPFSSSMLSWDPHNPEMEKEMSKFPGFHNDAISSSGLRKRTKDEEEREAARKGKLDHHKRHKQNELGMEMAEEEYMEEWVGRYGQDAASEILQAVQLCKDDYAWLRRFAMKPQQ